MESDHTITQLLKQAENGDRSAWERAFELVYGELKQIARRLLSGGGQTTLSPTGLVHECYLRLAQRDPAVAGSRAHFQALAARAMRYILINRARDRQAQKRDPGAPLVGLESVNLGSFEAIDQEVIELIALDQAMDKLEQIEPRLVRVLECRIFAGLSEEDSAAALDIPLRSVQRYFSEAKQQIAQILAG